MNLPVSPLRNWLTTTCQLPSYELISLRGDASFRQYFRVQLPHISYIAMDASRERASCAPFVAIANALRQIGLCTPEVYHFDAAQGFLLLTDFGDQLLLRNLTLANVDHYYGKALEALARAQACQEVPNWTLPIFTKELMFQELQLFKEWFLQSYLKLTLSVSMESALTICFDFLANTAAAQPKVFMYRDFHSANLMILSNDQLGLLDFQDAFKGPVTYDLVSLLRDCYIAWPKEKVVQWVYDYHERLGLNVSKEVFFNWFELMGVQRHLKALLTFSRKYLRDDNAHYLQHIPRTLNYILQVAPHYPECLPLVKLLEGVEPVCVQ